MKRTKTLVIALWAVFVTQAAFAQKGTEEQLIKDANSYFNSGEFLKAFPLYSQLVSLYPNHPDYNYKFGACAIYSEQDKTKAVRYLTIATGKGVEDKMAWYYLGKAYHLNYQFKDAIKAYENFLRNAEPKLAAKTDAQREIETCIYGSNLLSNIKDISVISKTETDKANFFRYFNLEAIGGKILTIPAELKTKIDEKSKEPGVIHYPGNSTTIYYSSFGKDGSSGKDIYKAQILPDGKFSNPTKLEGDINTKYDEDFCFMHSDGKTLYFASKGHNSMGGYDIFKSVYDPASMKFGPAVNLDFAINTPDDDIFYIADSLNKNAYFASGRASDLDHLNVYNVLVESTPLQIVYIKGEFISEINPDQHKAGIKVIDGNTGRMVCDGISGGNNGAYLMYVPKSGEYQYKVITENSPKVHEVKVNVPPFSEPVAVRQEMRLVSENGQDKLIITNFFEKPLDEDLSILAAEMLRKKSNLDVNTTAPQVVASVEQNNTNGGELTTFDKTMSNAPIAAGFANGTTISTVVSEMTNESALIKKFVAESDVKRDNSLAYASKKYKEADIALKEAENIRKSLGNVSSESDIKQLRKSVELTDQAEQLQMEAKSAMNSAESIEQYKISEKERSAQIDEQIAALKNAESSSNYDAAVTVMSAEKSRQTAMRDGTGSAPIGEMNAKVKARESEQQREERKLTDLRETEKDLSAKATAAESKMSAAKKEKEKQAAANEYATIKAELDNTRKNIVTQTAKVEKAGFEAQMAQSNVTFFSNISDNSGYGLEDKDKVKLSETEKTMLAMRLDEMRTRVNSLEITDPQMLAIITENITKSQNSGNIASNDSQSKTTETPAIVSVSATAEVKSTNTSSNGSSAASTIRSKTDATLARIGNAPEMAPSRRMILAQNLTETENSIRILESKRADGSFTDADNSALASLNTLHKELKNSMNQNGANPSALSNEEIRSVFIKVEPDYNEKVLAITNSQGNEIDRTIRMMDYKSGLLSQLQAARATNAKNASAESEGSKLMSLSQQDQQYESAIQVLENETGDVNRYKAAYEMENKSIIESDAVYADKLQDQITVSESYTEALGVMESKKEQELLLAIDENERNAVNQQLTEIRNEEQEAFKKLETYRTDLQLTASAGDPKVTAPAPSTSSQTLEDMMEEADEENAGLEKSNSVAEEIKVDDVKANAVKIEKMFKREEEAESIFAYESGAFEEIIAQHMTPELQLKNREKISEMNDEIFLIEAEMENEQSPAKLRKLDYKAEQVYLRRSLIEIDNSANIAKMTRIEYDEELAKANEAAGMNSEKIESKLMVREEIKRLKREADVHMRNAEDIRAKAPAVLDDIEKADYYRQAFAKEALAIDNLRRIQNICDNLDMLIQYSEQDLAQLRVGKVPNEQLATAMTNEVNNVANEKDQSTTDSETLPDTSETSPSVSTDTAAIVAETPEVDMGSTPMVSETPEIVTDRATITAEMPVKATANEESSTTAKSDVVEMTSSTEKPTNQVVNFSTTESGDIVTSNKSIASDNSGNVSMTLAVEESTTVKTETTSTPEVPKTSSPAPKTEVPSAAKSNAPTNAGESTAVAPSRAESTSSSRSNATASANAEDYYYTMPEVLVADLFKRTTRAVYSENKPIPVDAEMPVGVYYKVQIGAFRNDIPQNLYDEFAPVSGESLANGITRYTAGFFMNFNSADQIKKEIHNIGYSDAFVVAYRDGKRIPLYEAMGKTDGDNFSATIEKEYVYGDKGEAPKKTTTNGTASSSESATKNSELPVVTDYYKGTANAASATQVETVKGLFYTVQVGVYSKPVPAKSVKNISGLNSELTQSNKIRYTAGRYTSMMAAVEKRSEAKGLGISDAFITAYYNGRRITLSEADQLLKDKGASVLAQ